MIPVGGHRPVQTTITNRRLEAFIQAGNGVMIPRESHTLPDDASCYVQWGWKGTNAMDEAMRRGLPVIILDGSYFRDYTEHALDAVSVSVNGFHGNGLSLPIKRVEKLRERPKPDLKPWQEVDSMEAPVLVVNQLQKDRATMQNDMDAWAHRQATEAVDRFGRPVIIRPHPKMINPWEPKQPAFKKVCQEGPYMVITWTSTCGVTALIEGCPTVAQHKASPVYGYVPREQERTQNTALRELWIHQLSWRQYQPHELDQAWAYLDMLWPEAITQAVEGRYNTEGLRV